MRSSRVSYKIFLTFIIIIALPVLGLSLVLSRIAGGVDEARLEDRFAYAESYLQGSILDSLRFVESRLRQTTQDARFSRLMPSFVSGADITQEVLSLMGEYGLEGFALAPGDGTLSSFGYRRESFSGAGFDRQLKAPRHAGTIEKDGILLFASLPLTPPLAAVGMRSIERSVLEVLKASLGADFDIVLRSEPNTLVLTTRRDPFGMNLSGSSLYGPASRQPDAEARVQRSVDLPEPFRADYQASISLPALSATVSETGAYIAAFALATLALATAASIILSRQIVRPLGSLLVGVQALSASLVSGEGFERLAINTQDELGELTEEFNRMGSELVAAHRELLRQNDELKEVDQLKDDFLSTTSAELRSPLNTIISLADSMLGSDALSEDDRNTVRYIATSGKKLYGMIGDVLDYTKLEHGDVALKPRVFELKPLADLVLRFCSGLKKKNVELFNLIEPELLVRADEGRIEQVLYNLIGCAVRRTGQGSVIVRSQREAERVIISISDWGTNEAGVQSDLSPEGLDLPIASRLLELHGTALVTEANPGRGGLFSFSLPSVSHAESAGGQEAGSVLAGDDIDELVPLDDPAYTQGVADQRYRVLVVDEDPVVLRILKNGLRDRYDLSCASDGAEALRRIGAGPQALDIMLIAAKLPKISGYELCSMVRQDHNGVQLPIIMMTEHGRPADIEEAFASGANDVVSKPASIFELRARLKTHIELSKLNDAYARFVPRDFLGFLGKASIIDTKLVEYAEGDMTILVSDIRDFTLVSERLGPEATFVRLNHYLSRIGPIIRAHDGFIDKYLGDAIMAIFPRDPTDAIKAAQAMCREMDAFNTEASIHGEEPISAGIGIHAGRLLMGTIGEAERMDGTVISNVVNLAFTLEALTKTYGAQIIVSGAVMEAMSTTLEGIAKRYLGVAKIKGKDTSIPIYELMLPGGEAPALKKRELRQRFEKAVSLYDSGDMDEAHRAFLELGRESPEDPAWRVYVNRIRRARGRDDAEPFED
jgi:two-component system sensor histidine kinase ChiS